MKSIRFILSLVSFTISGIFTASACGPYYTSIPTPCFYFHGEGISIADEYRAINIRLWQNLTSPTIPDDDIEEAVYRYTFEQLRNVFYSGKKASDGNTFVSYIQNTNDDEIADFLMLAKDLEERRILHNSPWYYPADPDQAAEVGYKDIIDGCRQYSGTRLADRYALQLVRALFASNKYDECITEYEKHLKQLPAGNIFRRMALGYVAGCWSRLGDTDKANEYFAETGDFESLCCQNPLIFMATRNPDAPTFWSKIGTIVATNDSNAVRKLLPMVRQIVTSGKSKYNGDWLFLEAYIEGEYNGNHTAAARLMAKALQSDFSNATNKDYARAYRMATDAMCLNTSTLLTDLLWIEQKISLTNPDAKHWNRLMQNIIQMRWVPQLMEHGNHTLAVLLAGYSDNYFLSKQKVVIYADNDLYSLRWTSEPIAAARKNPNWYNNVDYSNLSFQLMYAMTGDQLATVKSHIGGGDELQQHLEKYARIDNDYLNELIGTIYLREQHYDKAVTYLSKVSVTYQRLTNIYKGNYLKKDMFFAYSDMPHDPNAGTSLLNSQVGNTAHNQDNAKLYFARQMRDYKKTMTNSSNPGKRAMATFYYAVGLRNSFEKCWALTQYYRGCIPGRFVPSLTDYGWEDYEPLAKWFTTYTEEDQAETSATFQATIDNLLATTTDPEALAQIHLQLRNLITIARRYPDTAVGKMLATSCDNWHNWLQ